MVLLESLKLNLNSTMPKFELKDSFNTTFSSHQLMGSTGLLILFTCNHCPYAVAIWDRVIESTDLFKQYGVNIVAINPNINPDYPADSIENMAKLVEKKSIKFPYLVDVNQSVAAEYQAQCTPDLYLVKPDMSLYYHGRFDNNWQNPSKVTVHDCKDAVLKLVANDNPPASQYPSIGCSIKWLEKN